MTSSFRGYGITVQEPEGRGRQKQSRRLGPKPGLGKSVSSQSLRLRRHPRESSAKAEILSVSVKGPVDAAAVNCQQSIGSSRTSCASPQLDSKQVWLSLREKSAVSCSCSELGRQGLDFLWEPVLPSSCPSPRYLLAPLLTLSMFSYCK